MNSTLKQTGTDNIRIERVSVDIVIRGKREWMDLSGGSV